MLLLLIGFAANIAKGQSLLPVTMKGKILSANTKEPVIAATILLLPGSGTGAPQPFLSDATGAFSIAVKPGSWQVKVTAINHLPLLLPALALSKDTVLGNLYLQEDVKQLNAVDVVGTKSEIELKTDKKVFNVGKDILSRGGSATDILSNVPAVNVDLQGNVSLRDNANVRILINGKPSMLTANNGLRQIPAASIEKVEVITNPSSAYEAQGSAGIINIILKKNNQYGFNASLQAGLGSPDNNSINLNASYKTKRVNLFSNIGYRHRQIFYKDKLYRINYDKGVQSVLNQQNDIMTSSRTALFYFGGDYYINNKNTLTGSFLHTNRNNKDSGRYNYAYFGNNNQPDSNLVRVEDYREPQVFNEIELNYVKTFAKEGRKWTTNFQYDFWNDDENQRITQGRTYPHVVPSSLQVSKDIESSNDIYIQSDYVTPLKKNGSLEMGVRAGLRALKSEYTASIDNVLLPAFDNKLNYDENIYGAYTQYRNKYKQFSYQLGLRSELSNIHISDREKTINKTKNYIDFFPTLHLQYGMKKSLDLQLSYSRRINRPNFFQLNPFTGLQDPRYLTVGNPDLDPMYTNSFELGILKKAGNFSVNPAVYYQYTTNYFQYILQQTADGYFVRTPVNLDHEVRTGAEVSTTYNPFAWWRLSWDVNFYRFTQEGSWEGKTYNVESKTWFTTLRSGMKFPKVVSVDVSLNYRGRNKNVQSVIKEQYRGNVGLSRDFWGDRISLSFGVNNIFDSQIVQEITTTPDYYLDSYSSLDGRMYTGTIIYRLNRKKGQADRLPSEK